MENKKKWLKNLVVSEKSSTFATAFEKYLNCLTDAPLAQLVEQLTLNPVSYTHLTLPTKA